jgi:ketosteroid isomerase-like protein
VVSRQSVELVRRFNESWSRRDIDAALECAHAEIELDWSNSMAPFRGTYSGHEGLARFWTETWDAWDEFSPEVEDVIECGGDRLVTVTIARGRGKGSGIEIEARGAVLWTLREGRIFQGKLFQTKDEALEGGRLAASPDNVELLRQGYEALHGGDLDAMLDLMDSQVEIRDRPESPDAAVYRGHEGVLAALGVSVETFDELKLLAEEFVGRGDHVAVAIRLVGRGRGSGIPVEDRVVHLWKMRDGKAVALQVYTDMADALEAVG